LVAGYASVVVATALQKCTSHVHRHRFTDDGWREKRRKMFATDHAATALLLECRYPAAPMLPPWLLMQAILARRNAGSGDVSIR